jgi:glucan 1,3-beta-glucosidase
MVLNFTVIQWFNDQDYVNDNTGGNPYEVARGYNSGSIDFSNLSDGLGSTASYVSDIANRLQVRALSQNMSEILYVN